MAQTSIQFRTLTMALQRAGNAQTLAKRLGVSVGQLFAMLDGEEVPQWVFLRAVDYLSDPEPVVEHTFDAERHEGSHTRQ